jgi:hypothetical protein
MPRMARSSKIKLLSFVADSYYISNTKRTKEHEF